MNNKTMYEKEKEITAKETALEKQSQALEQAKENITAKGKELSAQSAQLDKDLQDLRCFANRPDKVEPVKMGVLSKKEYVPYDEYKKTYDTMCRALSSAERAESRGQALVSQQEADEIYNGRIARWNDGAVVLVECIN